MKKIYSLLLMLFFHFSFSQVGIGTLTPQEELEIRGEVAFRKLEAKNAQEYNRILVANNKGVLSFMNGSTDGYNFSDIKSAFMSERIAINKEGDSDLKLSNIIYLKPRSSTIIIVNYNIPIYVLSDVSVEKVSTVFAGTKLFRTGYSNARTELLGGNRKFSFSNVYKGNDEKGMFLEGKWIEVLTNTTDEPIEVSYSLIGFVEGYANESVYFSFNPKDVTTNNGVGGMSLKIYTKAL